MDDPPDEVAELARTWRRYEDDAGAALRVITETAVRAVGVGRASVWLLADDRGSLRCSDLFEATSSRHTSGATIAATAVPAYFAALVEEEPIAAGDAHTDPRTRELSASYLTPLGIGALLDIPLRLGGKLVGVLCHEHFGGPRIWAASQVRDATFLASLASIALELEQRGHREALLAATLESIGEGIIAAAGEHIVAYNQRFLQLWRLSANRTWTFAEIRAAIAARTGGLDGFLSTANELLAGEWGDTTDVIELGDGRILERVSRPQVLRAQVVGRVWSFRDISGQRRAEDALRASEARMRDLAIRDSLTGLYNRRFVVDSLGDAVAAAVASGGDRLAVAMLDIDHFKRINDGHGHLVGDAVLRDFARVLAGRLRGSDVVGRYGGEEFVIVLRGASADNARVALAQVRASLVAERPGRDAALPRYTFSAGIAELPADGTDATALLAAADARLYEAKRGGRDRVV